jgi:hypothetical protein
MHRNISLFFSIFLVTAFFAGVAAAADPASTGGTPSPASSDSASSNGSGTALNQITVTGLLDTARDQIVPYLGATKYR